MKRTLENTITNTLVKKRRKDVWVNATDIKNYCIKDTLVDWLKIHSTRRNNSPPYIMKRGLDFENAIIDHLSKKVEIVKVSDQINEETCQKSIELIKNNVPVLYSVPFMNHKNNTRGIIDLLVRNDYIEKLFNNDYKIKKRRTPYYIVVDLKYSTLPLASNGINILNTGLYPSYKSQLYIYTEGINLIQGYRSPIAVILGRRNNYKVGQIKYNSLSSLDRLGIIDYNNYDKKYRKITEDAINWIKKVRTIGDTWSVDPPTIPELYPNMKVDSGNWNDDKKKIANDIGEITEIWNCGVKQRVTAFTHGITSWKDERCNSTTLGLKGKRAETVDKILNINRNGEVLFTPEKIENILYNWRENCDEMFVDFETFSDTFADFDNLPMQQKTDHIFLIGVYYKKDEEWVYKNFISKSPTKEEETRIMNEFKNFVGENTKLWHWHAEKTLWEKRIDHKFYWADLSQVFKKEPIVIKGCFNYGLKNIARSMYDNKMITTDLISRCKSGFQASIDSWKYIEDNNKEGIKDIVEYNKYDVMVLKEILYYLRENH